MRGCGVRTENPQISETVFISGQRAKRMSPSKGRHPSLKKAQRSNLEGRARARSGRAHREFSTTANSTTNMKERQGTLVAFCVQCGIRGTGYFCAKCGTKLQNVVAEAPSTDYDLQRIIKREAESADINSSVALESASIDAGEHSPKTNAAESPRLHSTVDRSSAFLPWVRRTTIVLFFAFALPVAAAFALTQHLVPAILVLGFSWTAYSSVAKFEKKQHSYSSSALGAVLPAGETLLEEHVVQLKRRGPLKFQTTELLRITNKRIFFGFDDNLEVIPFENIKKIRYSILGLKIVTPKEEYRILAFSERKILRPLYEVIKAHMALT